MVYYQRLELRLIKKGGEYFKIYIDKKGFKCVGIKEKGIDLINNNLEDIKNSPCRMAKK